MVGSWGASVSSGMSLSLKPRFYAIDTPLVTATVVATISQKAKTIALAGLKTMVRIFLTTEIRKICAICGLSIHVRSLFFSEALFLPSF